MDVNHLLLLVALLVIYSTAIRQVEAELIELNVHQKEEPEADGLVSLKETLRHALTGKEPDDEFEESGDDSSDVALIQLDAKWSIEEPQKKSCCEAAFRLCERPPEMTYKQFRKTRPKFLKQAQKSCAGLLGPKQLRTEKQICAFYGQSTVNCAFTPNVAEDWDMYFDQLPKCCAAAEEYCETQNPTSLFLAQRECMGYAARTSEEICQQASSKDCMDG